ncbi:hypothetical protein [Legionella drozanskii]|uniref:DNA repair protein n=1 Tax=Legionella drozanskii LLAP-1 TaxID=1212489 RepID=A0A0W0SRI1_9GAMM|nr:hypothetical protein [Legionella drozanskii]KTC85836.1 DNA repair protein [Legionella drozanskii LLAP-1]
MWYYELLYALIFKVEEQKRYAAHSFLVKIISQLDYIFEASRFEPVHPQIYLGLVDKMYNQYKHAENGSITVGQFTRELFALAIILSKAADDEKIHLCDFENIVKDPNNLRILGFSKTTAVQDMNNLEITQLIKMNYNVNPDLDHVLEILNQQESVNLHLGLITYFESLASKSDLFDDFLNNVYAQRRAKLEPPIPTFSDENKKRKRPVTPNNASLQVKRIKEEQAEIVEEAQLCFRPITKSFKKRSRFQNMRIHSQPCELITSDGCLSTGQLIQLSPFAFFGSSLHGQTQFQLSDNSCGKKPMSF